MRWELSDEQKMFQDAIGSWLERSADSASVRAMQDTGDAGAFETALVDEGWLGVGFPEEWGGQGGGLLELALMAERLAFRAAPSSAWLATVIAVPALAAHSGAAAALQAGEFAALATDAGARPDSVPTVRHDSGRLTGQVTNVLGGDRASRFVVAAADAHGVALYTVGASDPGVAVRPRALLDRSRSVADVTFDNVAAVRLSADAGAYLTAASLRAAVLVAADALGASDRMLSLAVEYSKQRHQFGVPIGSFQAVKHAAATMMVAVESSRSIAYFAAASVDQGHDDAVLHAAAAKAQVTAAGERCADSALTLHGAIGYTWEHDLQLYYKRAKLDVALFGSPSAWNECLASHLPLIAAS